MKIVGISGSTTGSKTKIAMTYVMQRLQEQYPDIDQELLDLAEMDIVFSDGRNYMDYEGDTKYLTETIMQADALIIGTPTFQASIPAPLKNVFDLLPINAFQGKTVGLIATAGSAKHFLMAEHQLKPILIYMKSTLVPNYVFIEEQDYYRKQIVSDDILLRLNQLVAETVDTLYAKEYLRKSREEPHGF